MLFIPLMANLNIQQPLFQSLVLKKHFWLLSMLNTVVPFNIFLENMLPFFKYYKSKKKHLFEKEIFCNIINIFTFTFDQFESMQNKSTK